MKALKILLVSLLLLSKQIVFCGEESTSGDSDGESEWFKKPTINFLITEEDIDLDAAFHFSRIANKFSEKARDTLVTDMPALAESIDQTDAQFREELCNQTLAVVKQESVVLAEDLKAQYYRQKRSKIRLVDPATTEHNTKLYLRSGETGQLYQSDTELEGIAILYDQKRVKDELNNKLLLIDSATSGTLQQVPTTGLLRYILTKCIGEPHAFHSSCIKQALEYKKQCPTCLTVACKKELRFDPVYKKGEGCDICLQEIKPLPITTAINIETATDGVMAGAGSASEGASASSAAAAVPPISFSQRRASEYQYSGRSNSRPRGRKHRRDEREDLV